MFDAIARPPRQDEDLRLSEILTADRLGLRRLTTAPGDPFVTWVQPTELSDPRPYLSGGEMVVTLGSQLTDVASIDSFVANVSAAGAVAIGLGIGDVISETPPDLVNACRERRIPLLEVPYGVPFASIGQLVAEGRSGTAAARLRVLRELTRRLVEAAGRDASVDDQLATIAHHLGGEVALVDGTLHWHGSQTAAPTTQDLVVLDTILGLVSRRSAEADKRQRSDLHSRLDMVESGAADPAVLKGAFAEGGLSPSRVVVSAWSPGVDASELASRSQGKGVVAEGTEGLLLLTSEAETPLQLSADLGAVCGISEATAVEDLRWSLVAAATCLDRAIQQGTTVRQEQVLTLETVLALPSPTRLRFFAHRLLRSLVDQPEAQHLNLVETLRVFLDEDGGVNNAANRLYLHPNSLRNRLSRIASLTGHDPRAFDGRVALTIALSSLDSRRRWRDDAVDRSQKARSGTRPLISQDGRAR